MSGENAVGVKQVLLVEDDESLRKTICGLLEPMGFHVREAENGLVAKTIYDLNPKFFDLIISDIRLPELNGIGFLKHVREANRETKFLAMTGFSELLEAKQAFELGADEFLSKPFRLETFKSMINACFKPKSTVEKVSGGDGIRYCRIAVEEFITSTKLVVDLFVHLGGEKYVKIAHKGDMIAMERLKLYREKKVLFFYVRPEQLRELVGLNLKINNKVANSAQVKSEVRIKLLTNTAKLISQSFYYDTIDKETVKEASQVIDNTLNLVGDDPNIMDLLGFLQTEGDQLYNHSVAISMYSCMIARKMGMSSQLVQIRLALGGLMHDIGKKELPINVLSKSRIQMTAQEFKIFETHCQRGKELLSAVPGIPEDVIQIAAHHHENNVGTGFPYRLRADRIHPLAKIVAVADCFFHTMQTLGVEDATGIKEALKKMNVVHEMEYDQNIVKALALLLGVDPTAKKAG